MSEVKIERLLAVRVTAEQDKRLAELRTLTGQTNSEIVRALLEAAVTLPIVAARVDLDAQAAVARLQPVV